MSVLPEDLPAAIEKLQSAGRAQHKVQQDLQERLAVHDAAALAAGGQTIGKVTLVAEALSGWDANGLKKLASAITSKPGMLAVLITAEVPALVVAARSPDVAIDAGEILKTLKNGMFLQAFLDKGRLSPLLQSIPVRVILDDTCALLGAAAYAEARASEISGYSERAESIQG